MRDPIQRSITQARFRLFLAHWLTATGWLLLAGVLLAGLLVLTDRLLALPVHPYAYVGLIVLVFVTGPIIASMHRVRRPAVAALIDQRLGLKDRLGTALYAVNLRENPFAQHVVEDAAAVAMDLRLRHGFPIRLTRVWGYVPPVAAVVALMWLFLAPMDLAGVKARRQIAQAQREQAQVQQAELSKVVHAVRQVKVDRGSTDQADPLQALQELAQLTERDLRNPELRRDAAARLSSVQEKLANAQQKKEEEFRPIQNAMSQLDPKLDGPADKFADALRRGDFAAAQKALEEMSRAIDELSEADKQALAQQLQNMAQQLQQVAQQQQAQQQQAQQQLQQSAQQGGLTPQQVQQFQQGQMSQQQLQQQIQQNLQRQGMSQQQAQQQAQQLAQQMQQAQQQQQSSGQCSSTSSNMSLSMSQMAQSLSPQGQQGQQQQGQQGQQFSNASQGAQQQIQQMAQMQQQLQQMQQAQRQMQQAQQQMSGQPRGGMGQGSNQSQAQGGSAGKGGSEAGTGDGGDPLGTFSQMSGHTTEAHFDGKDGQGRVIASWLEHGEMSRGQPTVEFDQAITEARHSAEQAVADDRVPRRFHQTIKDYFNQLPHTPEQVTEPSKAPKAPR